MSFKCVHISDIHFRGLTRHDEYRESFQAFFEKRPFGVGHPSKSDIREVRNFLLALLKKHENRALACMPGPKLNFQLFEKIHFCCTFQNAKPRWGLHESSIFEIGARRKNAVFFPFFRGSFLGAQMGLPRLWAPKNVPDYLEMRQFCSKMSERWFLKHKSIVFSCFN